MKNADLYPPPNPARDYDDATLRIVQVQSLDGPDVNPEAHTIWLTHGRKTTRAIVLFHGYTSSPKGFIKLGKMFYELGYNVLIPREPHHGLTDRMTTAHSELTAAGLVAFLNEAVDIAQGLGEHVTVAGLSMGGVLAAWSAQQRSDIDVAGIISPALGFQALPIALTPVACRLLRRLPNKFIWWDPKIKDAPHPPYHTYPRYASRALANILYLGQLLLEQARRYPPCAGSVIVLTNPSDPSVDNRAAARITHAWYAAGAQNVTTYIFDAKHGLAHDLIDPENPQEQVGVVYPILLDLLASF
jgi:carboxylesterase